MNRINDWQSEALKGDFDMKAYLLARYGVYMNKRELGFEWKKSRATIDNMRNPNHRTFNHRLVDTQLAVDEGDSNSLILFDTLKVADLIDKKNSRKH